MSDDLLKAGAIRHRLGEVLSRERSGQSYGEAGPALRLILDVTRNRLISEFSRGDIIAVRMAGALDEAIGALFDAAGGSIMAGARVALVATGGYGRAALSPYSDIDLLILQDKEYRDGLKPFIDKILYPLWDAGLVVGQGVHTPSSAIRLAERDLSVGTSYLDARLIAGDRGLYRDFEQRAMSLRRRTKSKFTREKFASQAARHRKSEETRYLAEPDIKESKGALRDVHTIGWLLKFNYERDFRAAPRPGGPLKRDDIKSLIKAERFLLSIRAHLHMLRARADDRLSFDIQPQLAERLGYSGRTGMPPAERMMKHYFVTAKEIGRITRLFRARLDEDNAKILERAPRPLPKSLASDEAGEKVNVRIKTNRLDFANAAAARRDPVHLFRYFRAFSKRPDIDFHPDALALISESARMITTDVRRDPVVARLFLAMLSTPKDPAKLLRVMSETGVLGRYVPSFGQITGRVEYGLYRRFSLDEHVFQSIGILASIARGEALEAHPIASRIIAGAEDVRPFYVGVLLHEAERSQRQPDAGEVERLVGRVARRLGLGGTTAEDVAWCAANAHYLVRKAERRNLGDPRVLAQAAEAVGSAARLDLLLVLTVCRLRAIGDPGWDGATRRQLAALYDGTRAALVGGEEGLSHWLAERCAAARGALDEALASWPATERAAFIGRLPDEVLASFDAGALARAAALVRGAEGEQRAAAVAVAPSGGFVEAIVYAADRPGLLADLAGAVASAGMNVRSVHAMTLQDGRVIDAFQIAAADGVEPDPAQVRRLHGALLGAAQAKPARAQAPARRIGDRRAIFQVPPKVEIDEAASDDCVVVEAEGRDRPGLLFQLTSALADLGVSIRSAHVATYGERAVDAFYLQEPSGCKVSDKKRLQAIARALMAVLSEQ